MTKTIFNQDGDDPLKALKSVVAQGMNYLNGVNELMVKYELQQQRIAELEKENLLLSEENKELKKDDEWSSRVTYENVVDQIASNEDAAQRDNARRLIEPLLKRGQVKQFRQDIKRRVKEMNEENVGTANITIGQADVKVQSPGNNIAHTINVR